MLLHEVVQHIKGSEFTELLIVSRWLNDRISEELLEDVLRDVVNELDHVCGDYAEALYNDEFAADNRGS